MASWGNASGDQKTQNMDSNGYDLTVSGGTALADLAVGDQADLNGNVFINNSNLEVDGTVDIHSDLTLDNDAALKINDINYASAALETNNRNDYGKALQANGKSYFGGDVEGGHNTVEISNEAATPGNALRVTGPTSLDDLDIAAGKTLIVNNLSGAGDALETSNSGAGNALKVTGKTRHNGDISLDSGHKIIVTDLNTAGDAIATTNSGAGNALKVTGKSDLTGALNVDGNVDVAATNTLKVNDLNSAGDALETINNGAGNALKVTGKSDLTGELNVNGNVDIAATNTLKVNDLDSPGDAFETVNSGVGTALKVTGNSSLEGGQVEIGAVSAGDPASQALIVGNESTNSQARVSTIIGKGGVALEVMNLEGDITKKGLHVWGNTKLETAGGNLAHTALEVINNSSHSDARALKVDGEVAIEAYSTGNPASIGLLVDNQSDHANAKTVAISGYTGKTLEVSNMDNDITKLAIYALGNNKLEADATANKAHTTLEVKNVSTHASAKALVVDGKTDLTGDINVDGDAVIESGHKLTVGDVETSGHQIIARTSDLYLTSVDDVVAVSGDLIQLDGDTEIDGNFDIILNGDQTTLELGTVNATAVNIAHANTDTNVAADLNVGGDLSVDGDADIDGGINVGDGANPAQIDAVGDEDLEIGGQAGTNDVTLGQAGNIVSILSKLMMNGNELWLDGTGSNKIVNNATGHVPGNPSIDVYIGGVVVAWFDVNGVH